MKDSRIGESLWLTWEGEGYPDSTSGYIVYYTQDHVDVEHEIVKKALASSIQRDGAALSLGQGFTMINHGSCTYGYVGVLDEEIYYQVCDENGVTQGGDELDAVIPVTWVKVPDFC